jgi:flagellar hook-associated protein 2
MMSDFSRITGLVSGLDTDKMIKDLMKIERIRVDKVEQQKAILEWEKDSYKEVTTMLRGFQSEFLDVLKPATNMTSANTFDIYSASVKLAGIASSKVSIAPTSNAQQSKMEISEITQLATRDTWSSTGSVKQLKSTGFNVASLNAVIATNDSFSFRVDGQSKDITLTGGVDNTFTDITEVVSELQSLIDTEFGSGVVTVVDDGGELRFDAAGHSVSITTKDELVVGTLGFASGASNVLGLGDTLATAFGVTDADLEFTINGNTVANISADMTISQFMNAVNTSSANVTMTYSSVSNSFKMIAEDEGVVNNIDLADTDGFFANHLKLDGATRDLGVDAKFTINGVTTSRSSNKFEVDGVGITLNELHNPADGTIEVDLTVQPEKVSENIIKFIDKYNEIMEFLDKKLNEEKYYDYRPLSAEEKKDMTEDDIKIWEDKAKSGLLRRDMSLEGLQRDLRRAVYSVVEGAGITLSEIGITNSGNYKDGGKLVVDKDKLDAAIIAKPKDVINLFTSLSDVDYYDANRTERFNENGFANRLKDILADNIRITRDSSGNKGTLIEKAGYELDTSDSTSALAEQIKEYESRVNNLMDLLYDKEEAYYAQFARLETAMQQLQNQQNNLMSQLGGA